MKKRKITEINSKNNAVHMWNIFYVTIIRMLKNVLGKYTLF